MVNLDELKKVRDHGYNHLSNAERDELFGFAVAEIEASRAKPVQVVEPPALPVRIVRRSK